MLKEEERKKRRIYILSQLGHVVIEGNEK